MSSASTAAASVSVSRSEFPCESMADAPVKCSASLPVRESESAAGRSLQTSLRASPGGLSTARALASCAMATILVTVLLAIRSRLIPQGILAFLPAPFVQSGTIAPAPARQNLRPGPNRHFNRKHAPEGDDMVNPACTVRTVSSSRVTVRITIFARHNPGCAIHFNHIGSKCDRLNSNIVPAQFNFLAFPPQRQAAVIVAQPHSWR
jgi:hypothetical protein